MQNATLPATRGAISPAHMAAVAYLARYSGRTRDLYQRFLGAYFTWCEHRGLDPLDARRVDVELFIRHLQDELHNQPSTIGTKMAVVKGFYRMAMIDGVIERDPAAYALLPKIETDPDARTFLSRLEMSKFLHTSATISPRHHALAYLLGILGLRISEAVGVDIEHYLDQEVGGHRVVRIMGKGHKPATAPVTVPLFRALEECRGDRRTGPLLTRPKDGRRMDRDTARSMVATICRHAGIKEVSPHALRRSAITCALDAGVALREVQGFARHADPRTTAHYDMGRKNLDRHAAHTLSAYLT